MQTSVQMVTAVARSHLGAGLASRGFTVEALAYGCHASRGAPTLSGPPAAVAAIIMIVASELVVGVAITQCTDIDP